MRLNITLEGKENFWLEVEPYYTIRTVKNKIEYLYNIPHSNQLIANKSVILNDDISISQLDLSSEDSFLVSKINELPNKIMRIYCRTWWGQCKVMYAKSTCKIGALKAVICRMFNFRIDSVELEYRDQPLKDSRSISSYDIQADSLIQLKFKKVPTEPHSTMNTNNMTENIS